MQMHGPRSPREKDRDLHWRIKAKTSEELRQEFLTIYVPRIRELGLVIPDPELRFDEAAGEWRYTEPDWDELRTVVTNHGPRSQARLEFRRLAREETRWVRETILGVPRAARMTDRAATGPGRRPIRAAAAPRLRRPDLEAWEVFRREKDGDPMRHGGSVMAPDAELAVHYAREMFGRRQESVRLWVVRRADILDLDDPDLLQPPLDRSFKKPGGYVMRDKLAAARAQSGQAKPKARSGDRRAVAGACPTTALAELLRSMADDEFVIGFSDSEWTGIAPLLEEDVAMSSLAQDELGHAAALYGLLAELTGTDPDALAYDREPADYRHCRLLDHGRGDWAMTIARRFLYDSADVVRLEALAGRVVGAARRARRQAPPRGALPPDARRRVARPAGPQRG